MSSNVLVAVLVDREGGRPSMQDAAWGLVVENIAAPVCSCWYRSITSQG